MRLGNLILPVLGVISFISAEAQDFNGCDYVRQLKVNTKTENKIYPNKQEFPKYNNFSEPLKDEAKNSLEEKIMHIYFQTKKNDLTKGDSIDLMRYFLNVLSPYSVYEKINCINLEGFADCIGKDYDNYVLSLKRTEAVASYLRNFFPHTPFYFSAFGETQSPETRDSSILKKNREVKIIINENPLSRALSLCNADVYLLDQSGSMNLNGEWALLQNYPYPDSCDIYSYSKLSKNTPKNFPEAMHTYDISTEIASGKTCQYDATDTLMTELAENTTLTTVVNGKNNIGGTNPKKIIDKAKKKNIKLNIIRINLPESSKDELISLASGTSGRYYFLKKSN
jgi:outer membrane protein OmpA-like peptidoglycan-associated protein